MNNSIKHSLISTKKKLHPKSKHHLPYDYENLCQVNQELSLFVFTNQYDTETIDFADPKAVKHLNKAILQADYGIKFWDFPDTNLCPPIPGRVDYIHYLFELIGSQHSSKNVKILDIGTGATCIYPLLGVAEYEWNFVGTDTEESSIKNAKKIIDKNHLETKITLRLQKESSHILIGVLQPEDKFSASMCNPPFYKSEAEALASSTRKIIGLGNDETKVVRNFSGTAHELWYKGGEKAFLHTYLYESSLHKSQCFWYSTLVSNKDHIKSMYESLRKLKATRIKTIPMQQGNKQSRIIAWTFLSEEEQRLW